MATNVMYIHDLPFQPRNQLCRILDADRRWEELGGKYMKYDITTLILIGQAIYRDRSPTWELLNKYSERNGTIRNLFIMLSQMDHQRAMSILRPYVDERYHQLLRNESTFSTQSISYSKKDIPRPSISQLSLTTTKSISPISQSLSSHKHGSNKEKENFSTTQSKLKNDLANMNQNFSSVSLKSKLKSLNVTHVEPKVAASKKSPDLSNLKKSTYSKEESVSDNCVSEKLKNGKKLPVHEMSNGKHAKLHPHLPSGANFNSQEDSLPDIMRIPYSEICKATDSFNDARVLGRGGFGTVYKGEWKGTSVAIKRLTPRKSSGSPSQQLVSLKQSLNELNILKCCRFDHILPLYAVSLDGANPCLIYQLMVNGSLEDRLLCKNKTPPLTWSQRSHIAECTAKGLNYLHTTYDKPLVHGDIKSANILLDNNMDAKIGDFGLTREGPGCNDTHVKVTSVHGTECYLPLEYLRDRHLSPQVDIFSYGIVLLEIATGLRPFDPKRETKRLVDYVRIGFDFGCLDSLSDTKLIVVLKRKRPPVVDYVKVSYDAGRLDSLCDTKAGEENMIWFRELIQIGQICSSTEKKKRPSMQQVLGKFEKVTDDMKIMEKIRKLSNDKGNPLKPMKLSPDMHLSPIEIQMMYDYQKDGSSAASENKKLLNISPETSAPPAIPLVIGQMQDFPGCSKESDSSFESLDRRDSYVSSESSQSENEISSSPKLTNRGSSPDTNCGADSIAVPLPLITLLQMQVSESSKKVEPAVENGSNCTGQDRNS